MEANAASIVTMIEFFSGIGGMRLAAEKLSSKIAQRTTNSQASKNTALAPSLSIEVIKAFDISLHANSVYQHNFQETPKTKLVEQLKSYDLIADLWTMSPPCQPFTTTRGAKGKDIEDKRCNGLKALLERLTEMERKPRYILLENVQPFSESQMRSLVLMKLAENGYHWKEYLVSPIQCGIPNHRLRYYLLAELGSKRWSQCASRDTVSSELPKSDNYSHTGRRRVADYLIHEHNSDVSFLVPPEVLSQPWAKDLGVVRPSDMQTHCFTAGYSRIYHRSTGSLLLLDGVHEPVTVTGLDRTRMETYTIRKFSPEELLNIFGFPSTFSFPDSISLENRYKLVGNSVNVSIVERLLECLLWDGVMSSLKDR